MGLRFRREKKRNLLLSAMYRLHTIVPLRSRRKLRLYLDLAWIFSRFAHEETYNGHRLPEKPGLSFFTERVAPGRTVLDIGCGHGEITARLLEKNCRITGVDRNRAFIERLAARYGDRVELVCDDVFRFLADHPGRRFDVAVLSNVLEHFDEPLPFLRDLRPAARFLYIEVPDFDADHLNAYRLQAGTDLVYTDADHIYEFDRDEMKALLAQAGWRVLADQYRFGVMQFWCEAEAR
jgi:SAM-dependent methyltransferase